MQTLFTKILIANRGEIAVRIIRACREMGIATAAVYAEADADALHTELADAAVCIGPPTPSDSYLRGDAIIATARQEGCDAIHPGYGFLAENVDFAAAVTAAGLTFIGPDAAAIHTMGSKIAARAAMQRAGIPVIPGYQASQADADLESAAAEMGFPVLVKAAAGGGGKGMRIVQTAAELPHALDAARREARNAFGDDRIYLEKRIAPAHHVEFQVLGDAFGNVVHLFERDCSVQRRHQKIIEETPSPRLDAALRQRMGRAAVQAARAVGYVNAGTIEFLVDAAGDFYFLEMNTRLQVEHPITELVAGVDLVKAQIRIAAGEPLPFHQDELFQRGHAIECRLYAEDPARGFVPASGVLAQFVEPAGPGIRIDAGVRSGDTVSVHYDPLLAKLCVLAETRADALAKMDVALHNTVVLGDVVTNRAFLRDVLHHPTFVRGEAGTDFVENAMADWQPSQTAPPDAALIAAALSTLLAEEERARTQHAATSAEDAYSPWRSRNGFRLGAMP